MTISSNYSEHDRELKISINGRFDFSVQKEFRSAYQDNAPAASYHVDLNGTDYMDSSALGMLLLLRKHAGGEQQNVVISGANDAVRKILDIAKFDKLFDIR